MKRDPYAPLRNTDGSLPKATWWRSTEHKAGLSDIETELPGGTDVPTGLLRRDVLKLAGASVALGAAGCVRRPEEEILPYTKQPEEIIPGLPTYYATVHPRSEGAVGLVVEAHEGKPTKIEGNALHAASLGASDIWAQSEILKLYDPDRARAPRKGGKDATWADWDTFAKSQLADKYASNGGQGLAILLEDDESPTIERILDAGLQRLPNAKIYRWDPLAADRAQTGAQVAFGPGARVHYHLTGAQVILALDADFLVSGPEHIRLAREFGKGRRAHNAAAAAHMNRLYVAEGTFSVTGTNADHRVRISSAECITFLDALTAELANKHGVPLGPLTGAAAPPVGTERFIKALAADLVKNRGRSVILVGERQRGPVHAWAFGINAALGALEGGLMSVTTSPDAKSRASVNFQLLALKKSLSDGEVETLVIVDANPVHTAPGAVAFGEAMKKAQVVVHAGVLPDETAHAASWHLPLAHFLEGWGDARAGDGTAAIVQPLILPLHGARAQTTLLAQAFGIEEGKSDRQLVEATWRSAGAPLEADKAWRKALHDGVIAGTARQPLTAAPSTAQIAGGLGALTSIELPGKDALELVVVYGNVLDGRLANNGWNQELPDPVHKLCWDNALMMAPSLAAELDIRSGVKKNVYQADVVEISVAGKKASLPVFVLPGMAPYTLSISAGYGKTAGEVATGVGVDAVPLLGVGTVIGGVTLKRTNSSVTLISTQDHFAIPGNPFDEQTFAQMSKSKADLGQVDGFLVPERDDNGNVVVVGGKPKLSSRRSRPLLKRATLKLYNEQPQFAHEGDIPANLVQHGTPAHRPQKPLQPYREMVYEGQQWGMVIDLSTCIGCNACVVACQSENNIPVVGRHQVSLGREMHWIRIDRYFSGNVDDPEAGHQPITCVHCESAPCEPVCPVGATVHDDEGLNVMAYNRCIGTRYCSNNCPYKVRRFNYLDFTVTGNVYVDPHMAERHKTVRLQRNPNVTVRYRGVMEKCTYCTQRIEEAKVDAKRRGADRKALPDGAITPACAQTCPTDAIVFGNINDPNSRVAKLKVSDRNYELLQELNVRPRTTFLARLKNTNEELA
jgi:molybdopterin-containing oxidoreductase family iron-sulfur binding subunit